MVTTSSSRTEHGTPKHQPPPAVQAAGMIVAITAVLAVLALAFALPATRSGPHDVPVGIAGPDAAGGQLADSLQHTAPGAFAVTYYPSEDALSAAMLDREVYGGIALPTEPGAPATVLTASGASPVVAQLISQLGTQIGAHTGMPVQTRDLAPLPTRDPRGAGLAAAALPITLAGLLPAIALVLVFRRQPGIQVAAAVAFAPVAGVTIAALLRYPLGSIDENFWRVAGALTLGIGAAVLFLLGLGSLFGKAGLAVGALLALLVGNPLSGLASAPEMLPAGWGQLGQLLPQGATATLLRSTTAFGGAGATAPVAVLMCWVLAGAALIAVAALRHRKAVSL
ncbi:ABC transporter permease [Mycolicibacterium sp.]|uniref:ABC transporter permease n=1 Tax=Mycolicibacterium sp. TaxID=2320850 RepID=UPI003D0B83E0